MTDPLSDRYKEALRRGHVAVVKGRPREAVKHYEEAGRLAGHRPLPFVSMGTVLLQMRRPQEANAAFDEALRRAPGDLSALRGKAQALQAAGRKDEAKGVARRAAELAAMEQSGRSGSHGPAPDSRAAEEIFSEAAEARAMSDDERAITLLLAVAAAYQQRNLSDAALEACYRALEIAPGDLRTHLFMSGLYLRRGWLELGVERLSLLERVLDIEDQPEARAALAGLAREFRLLDPALERLTRAAG